MGKEQLMYVDVHVHSYPTLIPGAIRKRKQIGGISWGQLEATLKRQEDSIGVKCGVFYGTHYKEILSKPPEKPYLYERTLPMLENHSLQIIGVASWDNFSILYELEKMPNQIEVANLMAESRGLAIIDQAKPCYEEVESGDSVFLKHRGEATIPQMLVLSPNVKGRVFLCYNAMAPLGWRKKAEMVSTETGLKLLGGSDAITSPKSLFRACSEANVSEISDLLVNPELFGALHEGSVPFVGEKFWRWAWGTREEFLLGHALREERVRELLNKMVV